MNRVIVPARQATQAGGIHSLESIPGPHKHLKVRAQDCYSEKILSWIVFLSVYGAGTIASQVIDLSLSALIS